jgi:hypothetical protein
MNENSKLTILMDAKNNADKAFNQVRDSLGTIEQKAKNLKPAFSAMAVAGTVAFTAISAVAISSIKAYADAEVEMAKFNATMETMGKKGTEAKSVLLEAASAASKMGFDDEDAANSLAKLYQRTGDANEAIKLNALAMDLARAKSIDLNTAMGLVNMALSGQGRALQQYGIDISETATPLEALAQLQSKVQGQAEAFSNTMTGRMETLKVQIGNLKEGIGAALTPAITDLLGKLEPVVTKLVEWVEKNPELTAAIISITALVAILTGGIGALGLALAGAGTAAGAFGIGLGAFLGIAVGIPIALGLIGVAIYQVWKNWDTISKKLGDLCNGVAGFFTAMGKVISDVINWIITDVIGAFVKTLQSTLQGMADLLKNPIEGIKKIGSVMAPVWESIKTSVTEPANSKTYTERVAAYSPGVQQAAQININFNGNVNDKDSFISMLTDSINRATELKQTAGQ